MTTNLLYSIAAAMVGALLGAVVTAKKSSKKVLKLKLDLRGAEINAAACKASMEVAREELAAITEAEVSAVPVRTRMVANDNSRGASVASLNSQPVLEVVNFNGDRKDKGEK